MTSFSNGANQFHVKNEKRLLTTFDVLKLGISETRLYLLNKIGIFLKEIIGKLQMTFDNGK